RSATPPTLRPRLARWPPRAEPSPAPGWQLRLPGPPPPSERRPGSGGPGPRPEGSGSGFPPAPPKPPAPPGTPGRPAGRRPPDVRGRPADPTRAGDPASPRRLAPGRAFAAARCADRGGPDLREPTRSPAGAPGRLPRPDGCGKGSSRRSGVGPHAHGIHHPPRPQDTPPETAGLLTEPPDQILQGAAPEKVPNRG